MPKVKSATTINRYNPELDVLILAEMKGAIKEAASRDVDSTVDDIIKYLSNTGEWVDDCIVNEDPKNSGDFYRAQKAIFYRAYQERKQQLMTWNPPGGLLGLSAVHAANAFASILNMEYECGVQLPRSRRKVAQAQTADTIA